MSGAASLAAAKRRRNPPEMYNEQSQKLSGVQEQGMKTNRTSNERQHPGQILRQHDKQIFLLERKVEALEEKDNDQGIVGVGNPELENLVLNSNAEIKLLKSTITKQQKSIQDLTSLVTGLRATVSVQTSDLSELNNYFTNKLNTSPELEKSSVKLDISEGK